MKIYKNSKSENNFYKNALNAGYQTTKRGYPDFLLWRETDEEIYFCFVEVKSANRHLKGEQKFMHTIFKMNGIPVYTLRNGNIPSFKDFKFLSKSEFKTIYKQDSNRTTSRKLLSI